jgi:hypothetical protein
MLRAMRRSRAWMPAAIAACAVLAGCGGDDGDADGPGAPDPSRIVDARVMQGGAWVLPGETPATVGEQLATLRPSYVSSLLRFESGEPITPREITVWKTIRDRVRQDNPDTRFAIELNALEYATPDAIKAMMSKVRDAFDNDGWLLDFYTPAAAKHPDAMAAAIVEAHEHGEFLGGNAFGISKDPTIPDGTDYIAVQDTDFHIDLDDVRALGERGVPVFFHMGNAPGLPNSSGCRFIKELDTKDRIRYVSQRSRQQSQFKFRFGYPIFFPECNIHGPGTLVAYNAPKDEPMVREVQRLMDRFG